MKQCYKFYRITFVYKDTKIKLLILFVIHNEKIPRKLKYKNNSVHAKYSDLHKSLFFYIEKRFYIIIKLSQEYQAFPCASDFRTNNRHRT